MRLHKDVNGIRHVLDPYADRYCKYASWVWEYAWVRAHRPPSVSLSYPCLGKEIALHISASPAYLQGCLKVLVQKIETALWECLLFLLLLLQNIHLAYADGTGAGGKIMAAGGWKWCRMLLAMYHIGVWYFYNELSAWECGWHQFELERFFFFYLRKLSAYKWALLLYIFSSYCLRFSGCWWGLATNQPLNWVSTPIPASHVVRLHFN